MRRRVAASCILLVGVCHALVADEPSAERPPNVILFLVDDMGWRDPGCYGNTFHETPRIDALAAEGMRFTNAYAACPVCSPTRASLLTGRYPARIGLTDFIPGHWRPYAKTVVPEFHSELPDGETTFAELLKPAGYASGAFGKWHLGGPAHFPGTQGFDEWCVTSGRHVAPRFQVAESQPFPVREGEYLGDYLTRRAVKFVEEHANDPFVLYLSHYAVHIPLEARPSLIAKYREKAKKLEFQPRLEVLVRWTGDRPSEVESLLDAVAERGHVLKGSTVVRRSLEADRASVQVALNPDQDLQAARVLLERNVELLRKPDGVVLETRIAAINNPVYAAMCEHVDESLGRVVDAVEAAGITERTVIVFFSDNGGLFQRANGTGEIVSTQHPLRGEKGSLYEGGIRVPCIVRWPGVVKAGDVRAEPISSVDVFPTIAELANVQVPADVDGVSLAPLLAGGDPPPRESLFWHYPHYHHTAPACAVRSGRHKLIEYFEDGRLELYDLVADPSERTNLVTSIPDKAIELRRTLTKWRESVGAKAPTTNPEYDPDRAGEWGDRRERDSKRSAAEDR